MTITLQNLLFMGQNWEVLFSNAPGKKNSHLGAKAQRLPQEPKQRPRVQDTSVLRREGMDENHQIKENSNKRKLLPPAPC